jgi:hypothetical protein
MMDAYQLIFSAVSSNALGVVLEPASVSGQPRSERMHAWKVCIGPLVLEVAISSDYPAEDYKTVIDMLVTFLTDEGAHPRGLRNLK